MNKYRMYIKLCRKNIWLVITGICMLIIDAVLAVKMPFLMNHVLDELFMISSENYNYFIKGFIVYVIFFMVQIFIGYILSVIFKLLGIRNSKIISRDIMKRIFFTVKEEPAQFSSGNAMQIMSTDTFNIGENGIIILYQIIHTVINIAALFYYMWSTFATLALLITVEFVLIMFLQKKVISIINEKIMKNREISGKYSYLINNLITNYFNYRRIRCFKFFSNKYDKETDELLKNNFSLERTMYLNGLINGIVVVINFILIFGIGSYQVLHNAIAIGTLVTFNMYANQFGNLIINIPNISRSAKEFSTSYERVMKMYSIKCYNDYEERNEIHENINSIQLSNINFSYNNNLPVIFNALNTELTKGNIYCITGTNGSGKSTFLSILTGEYPINSGKSKIDGNELDLHKSCIGLSNHVSFSSSACILFSDTIRNNLLLSNNSIEASDEKLRTLYKMFDITNCMEMQPDSLVNDTISNLSDGQKQKITLMRTLLDNKEIMIFDEPEKHLDKHSKLSFMNYLSEIKENKIIIIVSHSTEIQDKCDLIINIESPLTEVFNERA